MATELSIYQNTHQWVKRNFGAPTDCEQCHCEKSKTLHWSNVSGNYTRERSDWQQLCSSCHKNYDNNLRRKNGIEVKKLKTHCKRGHELSGNNVRIRVTEKYQWRICKACQLVYKNNLIGVN